MLIDWRSIIFPIKIQFWSSTSSSCFLLPLDMATHPCLFFCSLSVLQHFLMYLKVTALIHIRCISICLFFLFYVIKFFFILPAMIIFNMIMPPLALLQKIIVMKICCLGFGLKTMFIIQILLPFNNNPISTVINPRISKVLGLLHPLPLVLIIYAFS